MIYVHLLGEAHGYELYNYIYVNESIILKVKELMFILSSPLFQVSGAGVWEKNVELVGFNPGQFGASTQKAGPRTTPTAGTPTNLRARGLALKCVSGTRTSSNGRFQNGGCAF